ncbi:sugar transporter SWEET1-like isoform X2 [Antedon mediterranea]
MPFINGAIINISILWYGYLKEDFTVIVVNTIGSIIHVAYVLIYNVYSHQKTNTLKKTLLGTAILSILYIYLQMIVVERAAIVQRLGMLTLVLLMHGNLSPLLALIDVVKTKSSHGVALPFTIAMLVTSILWLLYGFVVNDVYILIPSISGMVSSMIQLVFVVIYPPKKSAEKTE